MNPESEMQPPRPGANEDVKESPTVMNPATPKVLGGNKLMKRVGVGGMGEVWLGQDIKLHRQVAIKVMLPDLIKTTPDAMQRFYQEARAVAKLNHQNIIQIFQIGEENGLLFFSMEWVDGESLQDYLKRVGAIDMASALDIAVQMVDGLAFACHNQVIHRDVKPANVMMDKRGHVKITDFGLAKIQDSDLALTSSGMSMGSPNYMSPEMAKGESVNHRADIYAVGITLFQMLTGTVPFTGPSATAVLLKHIQEPLPIPRGLEEKAGAFVVSILRKMTEKDADVRYQTYETLRVDLVAALERAKTSQHSHHSLQTLPAGEQSLVVAGSPTMHLEATPVSKGPSMTLPKAGPGRSSMPVLLAVVGIVVLLLVITGGVTMLYLSHRSKGSGSLAAGSNALDGEIFLKTERGNDPMGGETIQLYGDAEREQLLALRQELLTEKKKIEDLSATTHSLLEDIKAARVSGQNIESLRKQQGENATEIEQITSSGTKAVGQKQRYEAMLTTLKTQSADFSSKGYATYNFTDPMTQRSTMLSAQNEKSKTTGMQLIDGTIKSCESQVAQWSDEVKKQEKKLAEARAKEADLKQRIEGYGSVADAKNLEAKRAEFKTRFNELVGAQQTRLKTIGKVNTLSAKSVADTRADQSGHFAFTKVKENQYAAKSAFDTKSYSGDRKDVYTAIWIEPVTIPQNDGNAFKLTQDNVLVNTKKAALDGIEKGYDPAALPNSLDTFLGSSFAVGSNPSFENFVESVMTP